MIVVVSIVEPPPVRLGTRHVPARAPRHHGPEEFGEPLGRGGEDEPPPGFEYAGDLGNDWFGIGDVLQDRVREYRSDAPRLQGQAVARRLDHSSVHPAFSRLPHGHRVRVHAEIHGAGLAEQDFGESTVPTPKIEDGSLPPLAGQQRELHRPLRDESRQGRVQPGNARERLPRSLRKHAAHCTVAPYRMAMNLPTLSVIVTNFNGGEEPLDFLASVAKSDYPQSRRETIVVDSGSTDGSPDAIVRAFPAARLVRLPEARGLPHAVNQGLAVASGQYVFLGNDDLTVDRSSLRLLVETMERDIGVGLASGTVFLKYPKSGEADVAATDYAFHPLLGRITAHRRRSPADVSWLQSCALMIRRSVLDAVGGFDERFAPIYFDDLDFCDRTRRAGFRIQTVPEAVFRHGASHTMGKNLTGKTRAWYRNKVRYTLKREPFGTALAALLFQAFASPILLLPKRPAATHLQTGGFGAFWRSVAWNLGHLPETLAARGRMKEPVR